MLHLMDSDFPPLGTSPEQPDWTTNPAPPHMYFTSHVLTMLWSFPLSRSSLDDLLLSKMLRDCTPMWLETPSEGFTLAKLTHFPLSLNA
ncbi:hypothetical protein L596_030664 [Steinernema carpocapsae]|uniref:Uncharacterized protein n=1 Tax=Steinernema carpocapsae TaxID=34508 RepID=A0A4U5LQ40_STECR|nr:hypothetical protein L596_030664 [Steinernema carpocapsae]